VNTLSLNGVGPREPPSIRRLREFSGSYDKGRGFMWQAAWFAVQNLVFSAWWLPGRLRPIILRCFGAQVGDGVFIRHRVRILWPWKLSLGNDCWLGEDAWLLNLEDITIGHDVCISQAAFLCTGSHDPNDPAFGYRNAPIVIQPGAWVAARAVILPGVTVHADVTVPAGSMVSRDATATGSTGPRPAT
jgi:putative colanic acid biosynthesis acetyltransferase WcaF